MSPISLVPILPIIFLALATVRLVSKAIPIRVPEGHFGQIDGMRGYLAFFVFLHHSSIWYLRLKYHYWGLPPSNIYSHFGPTSVAFFFMITAFLFFRKLLHTRGHRMDWPRLYVGRVCRILPLYWIATMAVFLIVAFLCGFKLVSPVWNIGGQLAGWLVFMTPDINGVGGSGLIIAGITGSLAFEWLFYCSLPFISTLYPSIRVPIQVIVGAAICMFFFIFVINTYYPHLEILRVLWFTGGIFAALLIRNERVREWAASRECSFFISALLCITVYFFPTIDYVIPLICVIVVFVAIACGNTLFGVLPSTISRMLGQISYSIFVLHGLLLFVTFQFLIGPVTGSRLSPLQYWGIISVLGVVVVCLSVVTYTYIESPMIDAASGFTARMERSLRRRKRGRPALRQG